MLAILPLGGLAVLGINREHDGAACSQVGEARGLSDLCPLRQLRQLRPVPPTRRAPERVCWVCASSLRAAEACVVATSASSSVSRVAAPRRAMSVWIKVFEGRGSGSVPNQGGIVDRGTGGTISMRDSGPGRHSRGRGPRNMPVPF